MRLQDVLNDPEAMAEIRRRACGHLGIPLSAPFQLQPISARWPQPKQVHNTGPATAAREDSARSTEKGST